MSTIKVCDRCRTHIIGAPTRIHLKPVHHILYIDTSAFDYWEGEVTYRCERDLCNDCARELDRFLRGEGTDETNRLHAGGLY